MFRRIYRFIKPVITNYYLMTALIFVVWMLFFDSNNVISQIKIHKEYKNLLEQKQYFETGIRKNKALLEQLRNPRDKRALEKYAREKYLMKRPNEQIFLIVHEQPEPKKD